MKTNLMKPPKEIEMLTQPLTTEEGFLNPACMSELEGAIAGMGKTHERLRGDPEWDDAKDRWTTPKDIVGAFAMWACHQSPYGVPDGLENVCKYLYASLATVTQWETAGMRQCSLCEINKWLYEILYEQGVAEFDAWNRCKVGETPEIQFASRMDGRIDPDRDFIDLDALLRNVCITIRNERRKDCAFRQGVDARESERAAVENTGETKSGACSRSAHGSVPGIIFAVSNDGGKTGVAWRENVHEALAYLDLQNVTGGDYAVVAVRKAPNAESSDAQRRAGDALAERKAMNTEKPSTPDSLGAATGSTFPALETAVLKYLDTLDEMERVERIDDLLHRLNCERRLKLLAPNQREAMNDRTLHPTQRARLDACKTEAERDKLIDEMALTQYLRDCAWADYLNGGRAEPPVMPSDPSSATAAGGDSK